MKNILIIGVGGTGSKAVDIFYQKCGELGNQTGNNISALVFDTDAGDLKKITTASTVAMADTASVGTICDRFGYEYLKEWFPCDDKAVRAQEMVRGASQWRKKSYLAFLNLMNKPLTRKTFISALEDMTVDPSASCEVYVIASIAGGTGSGSFIPIALYAKRYLRKILGKDPIVNAMIALPDIYADGQTPENRIKVYSNAYAILRELNAINLVARNYNAGVAEHKKAPIRFRIGDVREPNVGLLFDASDKRFWTPEAAPFSQVFLLDRIPGLNSVSAHDIVLANSLYTILCTEIGAAFDSEFSNHELLRSQNNGSNAIYAGISTSQIRFPSESVLDYLAHKKTVDSCDSEWLTLHNATEGAIAEKEQQYKAMKRRYTMKDGEYAKIVIEQVERLENNNNDEFLSVMERGVYVYDEDGKVKEGGKVSDFMDRIDAYIAKRIESADDIVTELQEKAEEAISENGKVDIDAIPSCAEEMQQTLLSYFINCIEVIRRTSGSTADSILTLDKKKLGIVGKEFSIVENLLKKGDDFVHPVAAMVQLCYLRKAIAQKLEENEIEEWAELRQRTVECLSDDLLMSCATIDKNFAKGKIKELIRGNKNKSSYVRMGAERYRDVARSYDVDDAKHTNTKMDLGYIWLDTLNVLNNINTEAQTMLRYKVYSAVAKNLDILIDKYRNFFKRFDKEKEDLVESTKTAYRKDSGAVDSVINVYSSEADKEAIYKSIVADAGPATDAEAHETDNIVGSGVFTTVYNSAACEFAQDDSWNDKDSGAYRSLFGNMVKAYRDSIKRSEAYDRINSFNPIEAMVAKCGSADRAIDEFKNSFSVAQELATPSLRLNGGESSQDLVRHSNIMVFMMSTGTGRYLKKHAEELNLKIPADQTKENEVIRACAEEFIRKYSGNSSARVSIVDSMSDQVLYCTGEIMDITPLRIAKFNEMGEDNLYFQNYTKALENLKKYGTDMWNPHLGNNLHKRGCLPYMNEEKEKECDRKAVKALLYGFYKGKILYKDSMGEGTNKYFFCCNGSKITDNDNKWINQKNIAQLMAWIRNEDELVEQWSALFDKDIQSQMNALPSLASDNSNEISNLEASLTNTPFMRMLTEKLYTDKSGTSTKRIKLQGDQCTKVDREGPTAIELAYMIKTSEEIGRDCDDAERILDVLYDVFKQLCDHRTGADNNPERFIQVYKQQLGNVYESLASAKVVCAAGASCFAHFGQMVTWLNQSGAFNTVDMDNPMDERGHVCINAPYDYTKSPDKTKKVLKCIADGKTPAKKGEEPVVAAATATEEGNTDAVSE